MSSASTVEKAIDLLFELHRVDAPQGVTAISERLGIPKSSIHRLLSALCSRGLVERDAGGRYRPGIGLIALARGALDREPVVVAARALLESEAAALGETVFLTGERDGRLLVLDKAEGTGFLRAAPRVGSELPVHATAVGKLQLAFSGAGLPDELPAYTPRTRTARAALALEVERVRSNGWAMNEEEWIPGLTVVAAPIFDAERLVGALAVAAASARFDSLGRREAAARLVRAAARVSERLGGRFGEAA